MKEGKYRLKDPFKGEILTPLPDKMFLRTLKALHQKRAIQKAITSISYNPPLTFSK